MSLGSPRSFGRHATAPLLPPLVLPGSLLLVVVCGFGANTMLALFAVATLLLGVWLTWRPGEAPSMLFIFVFQWLQASIAVFYSNIVGVDVSELLSRYTVSAETAIWLSLIGLVALALGIRLGSGRLDVSLAARAREQVLAVPEQKWLVFFAIVWGACTAAHLGAYIVPGLSQPLLAFAHLKWAAFVVLTISTFADPHRSKLVWLAIFLIELAISMGGYFASFKEVFFFAFIGIVAAGVRIAPAQVLGGAAFGATLLAFAIVWTAIKTDYRTFVSGGASDQTVQVGVVEQWSKLFELIEQLNSQQLMDASEAMLRRISYVEFFGATIDYIPLVQPHENGALWIDAVTRPFMPRIFFPDKAALDDSEMTRQYTGIYVAGGDDGTSISIGYMGDSYIDFGPYWMMLPIFGLGFFLGWMNRWLIRHPWVGGLYGSALTTAIVVMNASRLETTAAKMIGGLIVAYIVVWLLVNFVIRNLPRAVRR